MIDGALGRYRLVAQEKMHMAGKPLVTLGVLVASAALVLAQQRGAPTTQDEHKDVAAVRAVIDAQAVAWNRGDLAGYMQGYATDASTTFVSDDTISRGWQTVLDRYKARYDTREKMGTLAFTELEFRPVGDSYLVATGRWQLTRSTDAPRGRFTLIFHRTGDGWRIIHDHTSSAS